MNLEPLELSPVAGSDPEPRNVQPVARARAELRARVLERVRSERSKTRVEAGAWRRVGTATMLLLPWIVFTGAGGLRAAPRPDALLFETVLGSSILAIGAAILGLRRGRSMLGRPRAHLVAVAISTPLVLLAWRLLVSSRYPGMMSEWPERPGVRCGVLSVALACPPVLGLLWMRRGSDPVHPRAGAAALGAVAGAGAWVLVDLWCPVSYAPHLLLGHVLPLVATILVSTLLGSRILTP